MGKGRIVLRATVGAAIFAGTIVGADGGIEFEALNAPWQFGAIKPWVSKNVQAKLHNKTSMPQKIEGLRFTIPDKPDQLLRYNDPELTFSGLTDGNTNPRYEMRIKGENSSTNQKYNRLSPKTSLALNLEATGIVANSDFTPQNPQFLIKTGSFASDKFYKNAPPISLEYLKSLVDNWAPFYDEDLYLLDTLGANGGPVSAGFIDTWYDQDGDSSLFQVQIGIWDKLIAQNSGTPRYKINLGIMGEESGEAGPMYAMSLVAEQEIMNVDMQLLLASGTNEKYAGLQEYKEDNMTGEVKIPAGSAFWPAQNDDELGPFNFIMSSYKGYIFDCNRKFFPYDATRPSPYFYTATPGMGTKIGGNSPQLVNAAIMSSLYYWFLFDGMFNFKNVWVEEVYRKAKDRRIGAKLALTAWRVGFTTDENYGAHILYDQPAVFNAPDITPMISNGGGPTSGEAVNYIKKMEVALLPLLDANINSVNNGNGGNCKIHDDSISLDHLEQFFFGVDGDEFIADGATGSIGKGGLLWHYNVSEEKRIQMWEDVEAAFNYLKNRAPSTKNLTGSYVSLRYDFIGILRVARQYFDIERPMPNGIEFDRFVQAHAVPDVVSGKSGKKIEGNYPFLVKDNRYFDDDENFIINIDATDDTYLDIDSAAVVEWTLNNELLGWMPAKQLSGDTFSSVYEVKISADILKDAFGDKGGIGWVRVTDRNFNSTVDTFNIEGVKYPRIQSASIKDKDGDGEGDSIVVKMKKGKADDAFALDSWDKCRYTWPTTTSFIERVPGEVDLFDPINEIIMLVDDDSLDGGAGTGRVEFDYPENNLVAANIVDSVGPAIKSAIMPIEEPRTKDVVLLTVSELLAGIDKDNHLYCLLKDGGTVNKIKAEKFEHVTAIEYKVTFAKDALIDEDSIRFAFETNPVEDAVGNKPASYNQWVLLAKDGGKVPEYSLVAMYDTDGDGDGDSIAVKLTLGGHSEKYTVDSITGGTYSWPGTSLSETVVMLDKSDDSFSISYPTNEGRGDGKISLEFPEGIALDHAIADKVGPALQSASLSIVDTDRDNDTLLVEVSEELTAFDKKDHAYFLFDDESGVVKSDSIIKVSEKAYKVIFPKASILNKKRVKFVHTGETVEDTYENKPMDINQWINLQVIGGKEPGVASAEIFDVDGDGRGDSVRVQLQLGSAVDHYDVDDLGGGKYSWPGTSLSETLDTSKIYDDSEDAFSFDYPSGASAGAGKIELSFPEDTKVIGSLDDKVGPVIDAATCLQQDGGRDKDTLILKTNEELSDNFSSDTKYVIIFEDESDSEGDTLKVETFSEDGGDYRLVVSKNAITYGDWIQFNFNSGIEDKVGNRPLAINQKVLITVKGGVAPVITTASIFDVKGDRDRLDGNGDSIFVKLELAEDPKALTVDSLKSVEYIWGGETKSKDLDELERISETTFAIVDESLKGGSGSGSVKLIFKNDGYEVTGSLKDKVAPVVKSATYYNWSGAKDTLIVIYNEELDKAGSSTPLIKSGDETLTLNVQDHDGAKVAYSLESDDEVAYGDSLWVKGDEDIEDAVGNEQATDENVRVLVSYKRISSLESVEYRESDDRPDGYIDEVVLYFDADLDESILDAVKEKVTLAKEREFTIDDVTLDDNVVILEVSQNGDLVAPVTSVKEYDTLTLSYALGDDTLAVVAEGALDVTDKLAPVIISARFTPADKENSDGGLIDELMVTYSEDVRRLSDDEPFMLSDASAAHDEYTLPLDGENSGRENVVYHSTYKKGAVLPGIGDSIWISKDGEIEDEEGNVQERDCRAVELIVGKYSRDYDVAVTPTPYDVANYEDDSMAVIRILPKTRALPDNIRAYCVIYDKVGNVMKEVTAEDFGEIRDGMLTYEFLPQNRNGRQLGEGSYAVQFLIETDDAEPASPLKFLYIKGEQPGQKDDEEEDKKDE